MLDLLPRLLLLRLDLWPRLLPVGARTVTAAAAAAAVAGSAAAAAIAAAGFVAAAAAANLFYGFHNFLWIFIVCY